MSAGSNADNFLVRDGNLFPHSSRVGDVVSTTRDNVFLDLDH